MTLEILKNEFSVLKISPDHQIPNWVYDSDFYSVSKSSEELSLVVESQVIPKDFDSEIESNWKAMKVSGILDFSLTGILSSIASPLADNKISLFAVSTFNTDYILVKEDFLSKALEVLEAKGFEIKPL